MSEPNSTSNNDGAFLTGLVVGGALGAIAALLYAPRTGKDTRRILKNSLDNLPELADDLSKYLQANAGQLSDTAKRNWEGTLERLQEAIAAGVEATQAESERLENLAEDGHLVERESDLSQT